MEATSTVFYLGDDTLGLTLPDRSQRNTLAAQLRQSDEWLEVIPGARGLTLQYDPLNIAPKEAKARLETALASKIIPAETASKHWDIPVCYAPEFALDMAHIKAQTGLSAKAIIASHTDTLFTVNMIGFTPGFAYLESADPIPDIPRLSAPRQSLPGGSVGLAGGLGGLYALAGPGGWPIIGRTPMPLFQPAQADPFCLNTGDTVRFSPISEAEFRKRSQ